MLNYQEAIKNTANEKLSGGSADVRCGPTEMRMLQQAFLQHLNSGILPFDMPTNTNENAHSPSLKQQWVRAAMVIRANSVARGHSAVRSSTIAALLELLNRDIIPVIPTRGSISASGDLAPLSYVAGMLEGNQAINCWIGPPDDRHSIPASEAYVTSVSAPPFHAIYTPIHLAFERFLNPFPISSVPTRIILTM